MAALPPNDGGHPADLSMVRPLRILCSLGS